MYNVCREMKREGQEGIMKLCAMVNNLARQKLIKKYALEMIPSKPVFDVNEK
jgi:hypothetical protein